MEDFKTGGYCALCLRASEDCICYGQKLGQAAMQSVTKDVTAPYAVRKGIVSKNNQMEEKPTNI
jgi:hypothetical protein